MNFKHVKLEYYSHEQVASGTRLGLYSWPIRKGRGKQGFGMVPRMSWVSHPSSDSLSDCVIGHPALSWSLDKFVLTSKWRILSHCQREWLCPSSPKGTAT